VAIRSSLSLDNDGETAMTDKLVAATAAPVKTAKTTKPAKLAGDLVQPTPANGVAAAKPAKTAKVVAVKAPKTPAVNERREAIRALFSKGGISKVEAAAAVGVSTKQGRRWLHTDQSGAYATPAWLLARKSTAKSV
jgi:hypothetical protein